MPPKTTHSCPHCDKKYTARGSLYGHVKEKHGLVYSVKRPYVPPVTTPTDRRDKLKREFLDDEISLEEYQDRLKVLDRKKQELEKKIPVTLNLSKFLEHDLEYCLAHLRVHFPDHDEFLGLERMIMSDRVRDLFLAVYKGQFKVSSPDLDEREITYWDGKRMRTEPYTPKNIRTLYRSIADSISLYYMDRANNLMITEKIPDHVLEEIKSLINKSHDIQDMVVKSNLDFPGFQDLFLELKD